MTKPKLGMVYLCAPTHVELKDHAGTPLPRVDLGEKAIEVLKQAGVDVVLPTGMPLVHTIEESRSVLDEMRQADVDCVLFYHTAWVWPGRHIQAIRELGRPVILFAEAVPQGWPTVGLTGMHGALDEVGIEHKTIYGLSSEPETIQRIVSYARAARAKNIFRKSRFCTIGGRAMEVPQMDIDQLQWIEEFGIDCDHLDQYALVLEAEKITAGEIKSCYDRLASQVAEIPDLDETVSRAIALYLGLKALKISHRFDFCTIKNLFDLSNHYCSASLAVSLMNDEGIVVGSSGDCNGALTAYAFSAISDGIQFTSDTQMVELDTNVLRMVSDGIAPPSLSGDPKQKTSLHKQWLGEARAGGISVALMGKPGPVTIARFARRRGAYVMQIAAGEAYEEDPAKMAECGFTIWPQTFVRLEGDGRAFVENMRSEYIHCVYDEIVPELLDLCKLLEIEPVMAP